MNAPNITKSIRQLNWVCLAWHASRCHRFAQRGALRYMDGTLSKESYARRLHVRRLMNDEYARRKRSVEIHEKWARKYGKFGL